MEQRLVQDYNIGSNLRLLRKRAGLTQAEVAVQLQLSDMPVSREIYAQIEAGTHHVRISMIFKLKELYKASYEEIFEGIQG